MRASQKSGVTRYETTVGRALLSDILPAGLPFELINKPLKKKEISKLINRKLFVAVVFEISFFLSGLLINSNVNLQEGYLTAMRDLPWSP